jgi:Uma2 family endonuclease
MAHNHPAFSPTCAAVLLGALKTLLPEGRTITNCPVSTSDGVKAPDVAWLVPERRQEVRSSICLTRAPEICVEVLSPSNTSQEIQEKSALYFEAGHFKSGFAKRTETFGSIFERRRTFVRAQSFARSFQK